MKYRIEIEFDRINPKTKKLETSSRFNELYATSAADAKKLALDQFKNNEKTRRRIHEVRVTQIGE